MVKISHCYQFILSLVTVLSYHLLLVLQPEKQSVSLFLKLNTGNNQSVDMISRTN